MARRAMDFVELELASAGPMPRRPERRWTSADWRRATAAILLAVAVPCGVARALVLPTLPRHHAPPEALDPREVRVEYRYMPWGMGCCGYGVEVTFDTDWRAHVTVGGAARVVDDARARVLFDVLARADVCCRSLSERVWNPIERPSLHVVDYRWSAGPGGSRRLEFSEGQMSAELRAVVEALRRLRASE